MIVNTINTWNDTNLRAVFSTKEAYMMCLYTNIYRWHFRKDNEKAAYIKTDTWLDNWRYDG